MMMDPKPSWHEPDVDLRLEPREAILLEAKCREPGLRIRPGQSVWLKPDGLETMQAYVRWSDHDAMGCSFAVPLHEAVLKHLVDRHRAVMATPVG